MLTAGVIARNGAGRIAATLLSGGGAPTPANVKLLCHFDGADGATSTVDSSPVGRVVGSGGSFLSTAQKKFGVSSSVSVKNSISNWQCSDSDDWWFGAGPFTIECWSYFTAAPTGSHTIIGQWASAAEWGWFLGFSGATTLAFFCSTTGTNNLTTSGAWTPSLNTWYHIAVDRDASGVVRLYVDGVVKGSSTVAASLYNSSRPLELGNSVPGFTGVAGYIDEIRIVKGEAVYGGAFTPPSAPLGNQGAPPVSYFNGGSPVDGAGALVVSTAAADGYLAGLGYAANGGLAIAADVAVTGSTAGGLATSSGGKLAVSYTNPIAGYLGGLPVDAAGRLCLVAPT